MHRLLLAAALAFTACERKPNEEEIAAAVEKRVAEAQKARASPTPKPGEWMFKNYKNPLEEKKSGK